MSFLSALLVLESNWKTIHLQIFLEHSFECSRNICKQTVTNIKGKSHGKNITVITVYYVKCLLMANWF